jgi:hypothetical protein
LPQVIRYLPPKKHIEGKVITIIVIIGLKLQKKIDTLPDLCGTLSSFNNTNTTETQNVLVL